MTTQIGLSVGLTETNPFWSVWLIAFKLVFPFLFYVFYRYITKPLSGNFLTVNFVTYVSLCIMISVFYTVILINNVTLILGR